MHNGVDCCLQPRLDLNAIHPSRSSDHPVCGPTQEDGLTRIAAITPAHREHLRQLKADFDRAYDAIEDVYDRSSPRFRDAEALYRVWIKAIDSMAMALLDDLDALDIGGGGPRTAAPVRSPYSLIASVRAGDVDLAFQEMEDVLHARDLIEDEEDDAAVLRVALAAESLPGRVR